MCARWNAFKWSPDFAAKQATLTAVIIWSLLYVAASAHCLAGAAGDIVIADFEGADYAGWTVSGTAFGPGPAKGTLPNQMQVEGYLGKGLVNSYYGGDGSQGTLTSPSFKIERGFIHFLIGGGKFPGRTCMNLRVDGSIVRTATGPNEQPGGSERLEWSGWDASEFLGRTAVIEIVDQATGGWGHINVDHIIQTERKPPALLSDVSRRFKAAKRYLNFPVKHKAAKRRVSVIVDGKAAREFEIELADEKPDFWVFLDIERFHGQELTVKVDRLLASSRALEMLGQSSQIKGVEDLYREPLRPQFHFSSRRGWNNDPNGLVFFKGEYHLYYQHNPYGWDWGNMHWGHAVSKDLVHWQELPIALYPFRYDDWAFSGSAVVDWKNTGGFQKGREPVLIAAYTSTGRGECILFSRDRGRSWTEYEGNPVVKHEGRDPRLLWHAPTHRWVMALYDEFEKRRWIAFYTSPDLKTWKFESRIEGFFECPDLFELAVDGDPSKKKWVLTAASSEYMVGQFDGRQFTPETRMLPGHRGDGFYAAQTYSDIPGKDGRTIQVGWGQMPSPGMPFNQMMCFPCELGLRATEKGPRLTWQPARELKRLRGRSHRWRELTLTPGQNPLSGVSAELVELRAEFEPGDAGQITFDLRGCQIQYDAAVQELSFGKKTAGLRPRNGRVDVHALLDRTSLELFADGGLLYMPLRAHPDASSRLLGLRVVGGNVVVHKLEVNELKPIWKR